MTATELQRLVVRLSNSCWVRHWICLCAFGKQAEMWIQVMDYGVKIHDRIVKRRVPDGEMEKLGFTFDETTFIYKIPRTNEDGTPYIATL